MIIMALRNRQVSQLCTGGFDGLTNAGDLMAGKIVHEPDDQYDHWNL
jgi:hypothetical protein